MNKIASFLLLFASFASAQEAPAGLLAVPVKDIDGKATTLGAVKGGKAWLVVNVASQCGYTRQYACLLYTSPSPRDRQKSRMPSSA